MRTSRNFTGQNGFSWLLLAITLLCDLREIVKFVKEKGGMGRGITYTNNIY